jgi:hypothetical protein
MGSAVGHLKCALTFITLFGLVGIGCESTAGNPTAPTAIVGSASSASNLASLPFGAAASPFGGNAHRLIEMPWSVPREGGGMATSVSTAAPNTNVIEVAINVHGAPADTDLYFQIAHDAFLGPVPERGNRVCDRVARFGFPNPPLHAGGDAGVIHTSSGGAGSTHITFELPEGFSSGAYEPGARLDQMFRVVNLTKTFELRTECMTLAMK